ncbi:MAG: hypothetical protein INR65_18270, partial [Gluconacetobacter diazotrophicus]|nr:hypothetical protein [Gluconacetobacter diazotrophicus]
MSEASPTLAAQLWVRIAALADRFVPAASRGDVEVRRRTQLFVSFSFLGAVFGGLFAAFYFAIGHPWGGGIVAACTLTMVAAPWVVRTLGLLAAGNV